MAEGNPFVAAFDKAARDRADWATLRAKVAPGIKSLEEYRTKTLAGIGVAQKWLRQNSGVIPLLEQVTHAHQMIFEGVKSGDGRFFEVYPAGTLSKWAISRKGYKQKNEEGQTLRTAILSKLRAAMPWLVVSDEYAETDHALDALVASLTARAAVQGLTLRPELGQADLARREGWIHVPSGWPRP
jgi:hypothetical protein